MTWSCTQCTFNNHVDSLRCQICGHSAVPLEHPKPRHASLSVAPTQSRTNNAWHRLDGWFCRVCTLLNDAESIKCEMCDSAIPVSVTTTMTRSNHKYPLTKQHSKVKTFENARVETSSKYDEDLLLTGFFRECATDGRVFQVPYDLVAICVQFYPFEHWQTLGSHSRRFHDLRAVCKVRIDSGRYADDTCYGRVAALSTNTNMIYEWTLSLNLTNRLGHHSKHDFCVGIAAECEPNQALWETSNNLRVGTYWREVRAVDVLTLRLRFHESGASPTLSFSTNGKQRLCGFSHIEVGRGLKYRLAASLPPQTNIQIRSFQIIDAM